MKHKTLAVGITLLFIVSVISPLVFGNNVKIKDTVQISELEEPMGVEWIKTYGGSENDEATSVKQTLDGGYIFVGMSLSYGQYGTYDGWMMKTNAYGMEEWNRTFGLPGAINFDYLRDVIVSSDGGYAFSGSTCSFNDENEMEIWLVKTDEEGNEEWNMTYGYGRGFSLKQTSDGGYIIGGDTHQAPGQYPNTALLLRTSSNGDELWRREFWGPTDHGLAESVDITNDGGFVLTGRLSYADDDVWPDIFLIKTDGNGNVEINTSFGGIDIGARGYTVRQTTDNGYIIGAYYLRKGDLDTFGWLIKTDGNGIEEWNQTYGGFENYEDCNIRDVVESDDGYVFVCEKDPIESAALDSSLIKTDEQGNVEWELDLEVSEIQPDMIVSIDQTFDGGYIVAGSIGLQDAVLIKVGHTPEVTITKPIQGLYFMNVFIRPFLFRNPLIIGSIDVQVSAFDDEYNIEKVEFYVDGQLMETDTTVPYSWRWDKLSFFTHILKAVAYNSNGNVGIEKKSVWKFL